MKETDCFILMPPFCILLDGKGALLIVIRYNEKFVVNGRNTYVIYKLYSEHSRYAKSVYNFLPLDLLQHLRSCTVHKEHRC